MHSVGQQVVQDEMDELLLELGLAAQQVALMKDGERELAQPERLSAESDAPLVTSSAPSPAPQTPAPQTPAPAPAPAPMPAPMPALVPAPAPMPAARTDVRVSPASSSLTSGSPRPTKIKKEKSSTVRVQYNRGRCCL